MFGPAPYTFYMPDVKQGAGVKDKWRGVADQHEGNTYLWGNRHLHRRHPQFEVSNDSVDHLAARHHVARAVFNVPINPIKPVPC